MDAPFFLNPAAFPQLLVAVFLLAQGILVLIQNPRAPLNRSFFYFQCAVFVWLGSMGIAYLIADATLALIFDRMGFLGVAAIPISTYAFSVFYAGENRKQKGIIHAGIILTAATLFITLDPRVVAGVQRYPWGYYIKLGPWSGVILALFLIFIPLFIKNFYARYAQAPPEHQPWHRLALLAGSFSFLAITDFLPAYGLPLFSIPPIGYLIVGSFSTLMSYFILRYHLADLKIIVGRSAGYITLTVVLLLIYTSFFAFLAPGSIAANALIPNALIFAGALWVFSFLKQRSQQIIDEIFLKDTIRFERLIADFNTRLRNLRDIQSLLRTLFTFLTNRLRISSNSILIFKPHENRWIAYRDENRKDTAAAYIDLSFSPRAQEYFRAKPDRVVDVCRPSDYHPALNPAQAEAHQLIERQQGCLGIPLVHGETFLGFLALGKKQSQKYYTRQEIMALAHLATPFAIAWENTTRYEETKRASETKNDFISIASHQLRTPLTHLKWTLELLTDQGLGTLNKEQAGLIRRIATSTDNMITLIGQLLNVINIERDEQRASSSPINLAILIPTLIGERIRLIEEKRIALHLHVATRIPQVLGDPEYTATILATLLDNAIRYTSPGGTITLATHAPHQRQLRITVQDTGIGIPTHQQENIFGKFFRASNAVLAQPDGTGLGLFYAKALVEKQGGTIWFRSQERKGTEFSFTLPLAE